MKRKNKRSIVFYPHTREPFEKILWIVDPTESFPVFAKASTAMLLRSVARLFGSCNTRTEEPIDILKRLLLQARFDFYLFFAPNDAVVGNRYDDLVITTLAHDPANRSTLEAHNTVKEHIEVADAVCALRNYLAAQ